MESRNPVNNNNNLELVTRIKAVLIKQQQSMNYREHEPFIDYLSLRTFKQ